MKRMLKDWGIALLVGVGVYLAAGMLLDVGPVAGPAPAFRLSDTAGAEVQLSRWAGRVVVLNFWGSWCPPCREEIPGFAKVADAHPEAQFVGIAVKSGKGETLQRAAQAIGITWPVLEGTAEVVDSYGVTVFPTTFVLRPDGTIAESFVGTVSANDLEAAVLAAK
jgi:peroxiredoxin